MPENTACADGQAHELHEIDADERDAAWRAFECWLCGEIVDVWALGERAL